MMAPGLPLLPLLLLASSSGGSSLQFYGGSLVVTPVASDGGSEVEIRSQQAAVRCHASRFACWAGDCGDAVSTSEETIAVDSYGLEWCLTEVRTKLRLGGGAAFQIRFPDGGGYWIPNTRSSSTNWTMTARVDLGIRSDTGEFNRPPISSVLPVLRIPRNCPQTFRLTAFDPDGDRLACRVPTAAAAAECGLCGLPSGFALDQDSCSLTYSYDGLTGFHAIELMLEDFPRRRIKLWRGGGTKSRPSQNPRRLVVRTPSSALSKLPLQFTVLVDSHAAPSCLHGDYTPVFLAPTPGNRANLPALVNRTLEVEVRSTAQYTTIRDLIVAGPAGISTHFVATGIYVIKWTPTDQDLRKHLPVCFVSEARDGFNRVYQSELRCVTVHVGHHDAVVSCNQTSMKVELEKTFLIRRSEDNLHLKDAQDPSCSLKRRSNATHLVAVMALSTCGTQVEEDDDAIVFRNQITSSRSGDVISRNDVVDIAISCVYPKKSNLTLGFRHKNPYAFSERGFGSFTFQFEFFQSQLFRQQVEGSTYPVEVSLKQMIYMQIQATSSIPNTELFVESCRATPYDNPNSPISYSIIENGCVRDQTVQIYPSSKSVFRFGMEAFEFIGAHDEVYITCSVILCESGVPGTRCSRGCIKSGSGRYRREASGQSGNHFISQGPLRLRRTSDTEERDRVLNPVLNLDLNPAPNLSLNLVLNLVLAVGCLVVCVVVIYRSRSGFSRSRTQYQRLPTFELD